MRTTRRVALLLDARIQYQRKMIRGVAAYARDAGWSLYVEEDPLSSVPNLRMWNGHGIIVSFADRAYAEAVRKLTIPVVGVEGGYAWYEADCGIPYFASDATAVARMAADHLIGQGFVRLAYCGAPRNRYNLWSQQRAQAFRQRARELGLPCWTYRGPHQSIRRWNELQPALAAWLRLLPKPVGIMAADDARARHVLQACRAIGARVPDEVAVIGVDNDELMCEVTEPPLTSVEQGARQIGFRASELLDRLMSGKRAPRLANYVAPERVVCRRSTDALAIEDEDVATAVRFIRSHACKHIRLADILDAVGISRSALLARFRAAMGRTIHDEVRRIMLERAQQLILSDKPLKQVATEAGFAHVQHMTNLFRRHFGQTPAEYRRVAQHGGEAGAAEQRGRRKQD